MKQICLYLKKNMDIDGEGEDKPIANSLKELINNMNVNPNIRKKEDVCPPFSCIRRGFVL